MNYYSINDCHWHITNAEKPEDVFFWTNQKLQTLKRIHEINKAIDVAFGLKLTNHLIVELNAELVDLVGVDF